MPQRLREKRDENCMITAQVGDDQHAIRAAHSTFVLEHLLGYRQVRLYEASMQEFLNQSKIR